VSWLPITLETVLAYSRDERLVEAWDADSDEERDAWFGVQLGSTIAQIRAKCAAGGANALDPDPATIPPEFTELAVLRLLIAILSRIGPTASSGGESADPLSLTADQRTRLTQLERDLDAVAKGELSITAPDSAGVTSSGAGAQLVTSGPRIATRRTLSGI